MKSLPDHITNKCLSAASLIDKALSGAALPEHARRDLTLAKCQLALATNQPEIVNKELDYERNTYP